MCLAFAFLVKFTEEKVREVYFCRNLIVWGGILPGMLRKRLKRDSCFWNECYLEILSWNKMIKRRRILFIPLVPNRLLSSFLLFPVVSSFETRQIADKGKKLVITFSSQMLRMDCTVTVIVLIMTRNKLPNGFRTTYFLLLIATNQSKHILNWIL